MRFDQEIQVVVAGQANAEGLICLEEVAKISSGVILTSVAITFGIQRCKSLLQIAHFSLPGVLD